jgi:cobalamin biosynthesis Mg chelatase CobN
MPKKTPAARGGAQRNRPKVQKNIELVRQVSSPEQVPETSPSADLASPSVTAVAAPPETKQSETKKSEIRQNETKQAESNVSPTATSNAPRGSAAARLASRRQGTQKAQQRAAATLVTAEHYAYVRRDLIFIALLAAIMFAVIIILRFVPGIGF